MPQLRIALTIPGAISLGAYEGGVLAALLVGVQEVNRGAPGELTVDAIAGASAGSITGVVAARVLLEGQDPVEIMRRLWVETPSLGAMRARGRSAPLSPEVLRRETIELLGVLGERKVAQEEHVHVHVALGALRGMEYALGRHDEPPLTASTYLDWATEELVSRAPVSSYDRIALFAEASGANAAAFPPVKADRTAEKGKYERNRVTNFPPSGWFWYTDGGTLDNEPLGRALELTGDLDIDDASRLHLLISPAPETPAPPNSDDQWSDPDSQPEWTGTATRTLKLLKSQSLYDDLRHLEKTNSRLAWTRELEATLEQLLGAGDAQAAAAVLKQRADWVEAQRAIVKGQAPPPPASEVAGLGAELRRALGLATGLGGKRQVAVEIVSPLLLGEVKDGSKRIDEVLAGDLVGHFGGFLDERYRYNDFAAGYRTMCTWLEDGGLARRGLEERLSAAAAGAARGRYDAGWDTRTGGMTWGRLPLRHKLRLGRLALRAAVIVLRDVRRR